MPENVLLNLDENSLAFKNRSQFNSLPMSYRSADIQCPLKFEFESRGIDAQEFSESAIV